MFVEIFLDWSNYKLSIQKNKDKRQVLVKHKVSGKVVDYHGAALFGPK